MTEVQRLIHWENKKLKLDQFWPESEYMISILGGLISIFSSLKCTVHFHIWAIVIFSGSKLHHI